MKIDFNNADSFFNFTNSEFVNKIFEILLILIFSFPTTNSKSSKIIIKFNKFCQNIY